MVAVPLPTRERILDLGLELLSRVGLGGVTLGVLAEAVGLSKSGLFAHFRSKTAVQLALLQRMAELATKVVVSPALQADTGLPRLSALFEHWLGWTSRAGLPGGCPAAAALFELDDVDGEVRAAVAAMDAEWRAFLIALAREAMALGHLSPDLDPEQFVFELCGIYLSHHAARRFRRDPRADAQALTAFRALVERARPVA